MAESVRRPKVMTGQSLPGLVALLPVFLLVGLSGGLYYYLERPGHLPLRVVEVTGEFTYLDQSAIEARVARALHGGFFDVDLQQIRARVAAMPWVEQVSVRRVWPDTLRMHVTEQVPLAYWNKKALVNLDGKVFRPASIPDLGSLPQLYGDDASAPQVVAFYLRLHAQLLPGALRIASAGRNPRGEWSVAFHNGLQLILGRENLIERQRAFLEVYPRLTVQLHRQAQRIDMRYEHGFAVRWREKTGDS